LAGRENFIGELEEFIFNEFVNLEPDLKSEDGCDIRKLMCFNHGSAVNTKRRAQRLLSVAIS